MIPEKKHSIVTRKIKETSAFFIRLTLSQPWYPEEIDCQIWLKKMSWSPIFCPFRTKLIREYRKPRFETGDRVCTSNSDSLFQEGSQGTVYGKCSKMLLFVSRRPPSHSVKDEQEEIIRGKFYQRVDQIHLTMEKFQVELTSGASAQLFTDITLNSSRKVCRGNRIWRGMEVAIFEISTLSEWQKIVAGKSMFMKFVRCSLSSVQYSNLQYG